MAFINLQKAVLAFEMAFEDLQKRFQALECHFVSLQKHFLTLEQSFEGLQKGKITSSFTLPLEKSLKNVLLIYLLLGKKNLHPYICTVFNGKAFTCRKYSSHAFLFSIFPKGTGNLLFVIMTINNFMQKALPLFKEEFTDIFFSFIQNDKEVMKAYLETIASEGNLQTVNSHIAQQLAQEFSLTNTKEICDMPKSNLIQSYSKLK